MCASYEARFSVKELVDAFAAANAALKLTRGLPNLEPRERVRPTDPAPAIRVGDDGQPDLFDMRFGFPPPRPKAGPVINFRSEGRTLRNGDSGGRCLVPVSGFYEFTGDKYPKTRWIFRDPERPFLALAGVWRRTDQGEAFALLTAEPGPDVAPYHSRGVLPVQPDLWADWLYDRRPAQDVLSPPPAGALIVARA